MRPRPALRLRAECYPQHGMLELMFFRAVMVAFIILANSFFVAAEFALISVRETRMEQLVAHGQGERAGLGPGQAAEIDGHEKRGHLVIQNLAGSVSGNDFFDLCRVKCLPVTLGFDEGEEIHRLRLANWRWKAIQKPYRAVCMQRRTTDGHR